MGAQPSKTAADAASEKALLERLRKFQVADDGVVNAAGSSDENEKRGSVKLVREPEGLPVQQTQSWQSHFLADPKNRYAPPPTVSSFTSRTSPEEIERERKGG